MNYEMNEGKLILPHEFEDGSMTILKFPALESSLVIVRGLADPDMSLDDCAEMQRKLFFKEFKTVALGQNQKTQIGKAPETFPAIEFSAEFVKSQSAHFQINLLLKKNAHFLTFSYTQNRLFSQTDLHNWEAIKESFVASDTMRNQFGEKNE